MQGPHRRSRRQVLAALSACGTLSLAGCGDGSEQTQATTTPFRTATTTATPVPPVEGSWPSFRADSGNTATTAETGPTDGLTERWRVETDRFGAAEPVVLDGTVYTATDDGTAYAIDAATGDPEWTADLGGEVTAWLSGTAVTDELVAIGTLTGSFVAIDRADGTPRWEVELPAMGPDMHVLAAPTVYEDTLYVVPGKASLHRLDTADGATRWTADPVGDALGRTSPAVGTDGVYTTLDGSCFKYSHDGTKQWRFDLPGGGFAASPVLTETAITLLGPRGTVYRLDPTTGDVRWRTDLPGEARYALAVTEDTVVAGDDSGAVTALAATDGSERWQTVVAPEARIVRYLTVCENRIYATATAGRGDDHVNGLTSGGDVAFTHEVETLNNPSVVDGRLFVATTDGVFCYGK